MIIDTYNQFAAAESVAGTAGSALIGDVINLQEARDIGAGEPVYVVIQCSTDIITGGAAGTIAFSLASDAQAAIATDGSATTHYSTGTFVTDDGALNELDAGDTIAVFALPMEDPAYEQYLGILATVATTTVTAGAINAFITKDVAKWKAYADGSN